MHPRTDLARRSDGRKLALFLTAAVLLNFLAPLVFISGSSARANPAGKSALEPAAESSAATEFIRKIPLATNDIVYNSSTGMLYASVPSSAGANGNSITPVAPTTGALGNSVFIGSEPTKLALSDDGESLYVSLEGAYSIRRFNVATQTPGQQFTLAQEANGGIFRANDLAVAPGNPNLLAVARHYPGTSPPGAGVAVFENGIQHQKTGPGHSEASDFLAFSASASKLYGSGYYYGLRTMTVDSTGVTVNSRMDSYIGPRIKFDNGRIYSSSGQVMNPDTQTLLGTFTGVSTYVGAPNAFVVDSSAGRIYYLMRDGSNNVMTLKAFDINTFVLVGTLPIANVSGDPVTLVRWGANGLAFCTSEKQLYTVQTSLIPSAEPIPTPTPTPAPTPTPTPAPTPAITVTELPLAANDLISDSSRQLIYASVSSSVAGSGNSIATINPATAQVISSVFIGSEPTRMAMTNEGQYLYVALSQTAAVRRLDLNTQTAGLQFGVGGTLFDGPFYPRDLATIPGQPDVVVVSRYGLAYSPDFEGVAVYENGLQRTTTTPDHTGSDYIESTETATTIYGSAMQKLAVGSGGISIEKTLKPYAYSYEDIRYQGGLIFGPRGQVIDPVTNSLKGTFAGVSGNNYTLVAPDVANGRVFFLTGGSGNNNAILRAYDLNTFLLIGSVTIPNVPGVATGLVRWGANGLAFCTNFNSSVSVNSTATRRIYLVQTSLVSDAPITPPAQPTPTPTPSTLPPVVEVKQLSLATNDLVYDPAGKMLYASVPSSAGANGNSITPINPQTATLGTSVFIGSEPKKLAISDNGQYIYAALDGAGAVRRFDVATQTPGLQFALGSSQYNGIYKAQDIAVLPSAPESVAISRRDGNSSGSGIVIYDNDVQRPTVGGGTYYANPIEFSAAGDLYNYETSNAATGFRKYSVTSQGLTLARTTPAGGSGDFRIAGGRAYMPQGHVIDLETGLLAGRFVGTAYNSIVVPDVENGRVYFLTSPDDFGSTTNTMTLKAYDINTYLLIGSVQIPGISGQPTSLTRWGANGLAFRTGSTFTGTGNQIFLIRTTLVPSSEVIPATVQLSSPAPSASESGASMTITVLRGGNNAEAVTVNYATSDGTAVAGQDYTATSGTLTFAVGEVSKTITVPILNDQIFEGNESFDITLSDPTGANLVGPNSQTLTIFENDSQPFVLTSTITVAEPDAGTTSVPVEIRLSNPTTRTVTISYETTNGTATAGNDYSSVSGTVTFNPLETTKSVYIPIHADSPNEGSEVFHIALKTATNVSIFSTHYFINITNAPAGSLRFDTSAYTIDEGAGGPTIAVMRTGGAAGTVTIDYSTSNGTAVAGQDYTATSGTLTFVPGETLKYFTLPVADDALVENIETVNLTLSNPTGGATLGSPVAAVLNITNNDVTPTPTAEVKTWTQGGRTYAHVLLTFPDTGYRVADWGQLTHAGADYLTDSTIQRLTGQYAQAQMTSVQIFDLGQLAAGNYTFTFKNLGATLVSKQFTVTDGPSQPNPLDNEDQKEFVRWQYKDFLGREPDQAGWDFWTSNITQCSDPSKRAAGQTLEQCIDKQRVTTSGAFFLSPEFQYTGYFVYRMYKGGLGRAPYLSEFKADQAIVGQGIVVDNQLSGAVINQNKASFADEFVRRPEFVAIYGSLNNQDYVLRLFQTTGVTPTTEERDALISGLNNNTETRASVLLKVVDGVTIISEGNQQFNTLYGKAFYDREFNVAFVLMEYFGYMKRDADAPGYEFWLGKLNQYGNYIDAEMVRSFIVSPEYRSRFGQP